MKIVYITLSTSLVFMTWYFRRKDQRSNLAQMSPFIENPFYTYAAIVAPCLAYSILAGPSDTALEKLWHFSIVLEAFSIIPQLSMMRAYAPANIPNSVVAYVAMLGGYRLLYICNWVYRYVSEADYRPSVWVWGVIQALLFSEFFFVYIRKLIRSRLRDHPSDTTQDDHSITTETTTPSNIIRLSPKALSGENVPAQATVEDQP
eukprot:CAMPEP_0184663002 /NCGR_PEP_ID=MMETSP0308-20130426/46023_1 /TAXON_ID=38269 /ORGANISM="Gloeochaete witrockiana, Strain SAG 46.84" /LENGTH=203 /DNA_ID=CAMNT_0027105425 /DNA_START=268 /DNA_END=879 /DNA_ORIENTATION=-